MSDFKKICLTFPILKLQKCDAYQNGVEFCHKPNGNNVKWPLLYFAFRRPCPLHLVPPKPISPKDLTSCGAGALLGL